MRSNSAALAANRLVGLEPESTVKAEASAFFQANIAGKGIAEIKPVIDIDSGTVDISADVLTKTYFLGLVGINEQEQHLRARSVAGAATYEVVMVLDNSGSMAGSKIASLEQAAKDLTKALFEVNASNPKPDPVKIGVVPFAAAVNVGSQYDDASWMDTDAEAPYHSENFDEPTSRFDLFDALEDVTWQGCVEARPHPYDVEDIAPAKATPATMFVPMFAPDESDENYFSNNYLADDGGSCEFAEDGGRGHGRRRHGGRGGGANGTKISDLSDAERQALTCKYDGVNLSGTHHNGVDRGPNYNCTANPLQPLSTSRSRVEATLGLMKADGMTNIHDGIMWGWRLLSPGKPFTQGRPYGEEDNRKILIVMTDGENTYTSYNNFNKSMYGAFGYIGKDHLDTTSTSNGTVVGKMDDRTEEACNNVKATGDITVYTVAFKVSSQSTREMLERCASRSDMAFRSDSNSDLVDTFGQIAKEISLLRLEK